jgi:formylglycine-generating enzyme required for sulfatase activity
VNRGGSWYEPASDLRPSIRYANPEEARYKTVGLRLVKGS